MFLELPYIAYTQALVAMKQRALLLIFLLHQGDLDGTGGNGRIE